MSSSPSPAPTGADPGESAAGTSSPGGSVPWPSVKQGGVHHRAEDAGDPGGAWLRAVGGVGAQQPGGTAHPAPRPVRAHMDSEGWQG